jgi:hypothetical protein
MKLIKLAIISIVLLFLLVTAVSLLFPSHVRISRATDISASKDSAMVMLRNPLNWKYWFPGADTLAVVFLNGKPIGLKLADGKELKISSGTDSSTNAQIDGASFYGTGWNCISDGTADHITVQWYMDFQLKWYPWEKFSSLLLESRYGYQMEQGLQKLKAKLESAQ